VNLWEEPGAGNLHARIREGESRMAELLDKINLPAEIEVRAPSRFLIRDLVVKLEEKRQRKETRRHGRPSVITAVEEGELLVAKDLVPVLREEAVEALRSHTFEKLTVRVEK